MTDAEHAAVLRRLAEGDHRCVYVTEDQRAAIERAIEKLDPLVSPRFDYSDPVTYDEHVHRDFVELWEMCSNLEGHLYCTFNYDADGKLFVHHHHGRKVDS